LITQNMSLLPLAGIDSRIQLTNRETLNSGDISKTVDTSDCNWYLGI
jgi:hypothetical protein